MQRDLKVSSPPMRPDRKIAAFLSIILLLALGTRLLGIDFGLPYLYHPDEPNKVQIAQNMVKTLDLNPHYFLKPTLFLYLNALAYIPYLLLGKVLGVLQSPADLREPIVFAMGIGKSELPDTILLGRLVTLVFSIGAVGLIYLVGKRLYGSPWIGLMAAVMLAVSPTAVTHSRFITVDAFVVFTSLAVLWFSASILVRLTWRDYILAGISVGLTASFKYPGVLVAVIPLAAHLLHFGWRRLLAPRIFVCMLLVPVAFFATSPFAVLDYQKFLQDALYESQHYSTGHLGMEGNSPSWYTVYLLREENPFALLALVEIFRAIIKRDKASLLVGVFPVVYFIFISSFVVRNDRTLLPLLPFVFLLVARVLNISYAWLRRRPWGASVRFYPVIAVAVILLILAVPLFRTGVSTANLTFLDSREDARRWIVNNVPPGAKIAVEAYAPYLEPDRYIVQNMTPLIDHPITWYDEQSFDYVVTSSQWFGRFFREPEQYGREVELYGTLFDQMTMLRSFAGGDTEIRVYQLSQ